MPFDTQHFAGPSGGHKPKPKRKEVAGPYRSQSSVPSIRKEATPHEHRKVLPSAPPIGPTRAPRPPRLPHIPTIAAPQGSDYLKLPTTGPVAVPTPEVAVLDALLHGVAPPRSLEREYGTHAFRRAQNAYIHHIAGEENLGEPEDLTNAVLAASGVGELASLGRTVGEIGVRDALKGLASGGAREAASAGESSGIKAVLKGAAKKAEPDAVAAAREAAAKAIPGEVKAAAKVAAKAGSYPVRHPIQAPFALQAPAALIHGNPKEFLKPLYGTGTFANAAHDIGQALGGVPGEAVSLPATVLPTAFLVGKGLYNAAHGHNDELNKLWASYVKTGLLPALAKGDFAEALKRLQEHPLYSALEGSGALSALGRGLGFTARALPGTSLGETGGRAPLPIEGTGLWKDRRYSRDLIRKGAQQLYDRTQFGQRVKPGTFRARRIQKEAQNRFASNAEARRRQQQYELGQALKDTLPRRGPTVTVRGRTLGRIDRRSAEVVNLAVERLIQHPWTFREDLPMYRHLIESAAKEQHLSPPQLQRHEALLEQIKKAEGIKSPERIQRTVDAANAFINLQQPILNDLLDLKLLTPEQARTARLISFARVHMGAGYGRAPEIDAAIKKVRAEMSRATSPEMQGRLLAKLSKLQDQSHLLDHNGNKLTAEQVQAELAARGISEPGFLSHQAPTPGDHYQPSFGGASLPKGTRTGASVLAGTQLGGIESLVRQLRRAHGLVHRARTWNSAVTTFAHEVPGVDTFREAKKVIEDPAKYGLDPREKWVTVPRHPFTAKKLEREGALEHQEPARALLEEPDAGMAEDAAGKLLHDEIDKGIKGELDPKAKVAFMPLKVAKEFRSEAAPSPAGLKAAQAATGAFKRAVLPFSPGFYIGNGFDNAMRSVLAGINPAHYVLGKIAERHLTPEVKAELLAGAHFSSVDRLAPHRSVESIFVGEDVASKAMRAAAEWSRKHGWKQAAVKFLPRAVAGLSHYLLSANALLTERLPQTGALGKVVLGEIRDTQGSWTKAIRHFNEGAKQFATGTADLPKLIQLQKDLEETFGNYTRMSPGARKLLSTAVPFWTWMRAAYKFVYVTMPAHHPIQTGLLTAAQRAEQAHLEAFGLYPEGEKPIESYLRGGIPVDATGGVVPTANYNSFGFAASPVEAAERGVFPQGTAAREALAGRNSFGEPLATNSEGKEVAAAVWGVIAATIPGINLLTKESGGGGRTLEPHISLPHEYNAEKVAQARVQRQTISVPVKGESSGPSSSSSGLWGGGSSSSSSSSSGGGLWK